MTTSVDIRARAWGALATVARAKGDTEELELTANENRTIHLDDGDSITVRQGQNPEEAGQVLNTAGSARAVTSDQLKAAAGADAGNLTKSTT